MALNWCKNGLVVSDELSDVRVDTFELNYPEIAEYAGQDLVFDGLFSALDGNESTLITIRLW